MHAVAAYPTRWHSCHPLRVEYIWAMFMLESLPSWKLTILTMVYWHLFQRTNSHSVLSSCVNKSCTVIGVNGTQLSSSHLLPPSNTHRDHDPEGSLPNNLSSSQTSNSLLCLQSKRLQSRTGHCTGSPHTVQRRDSQKGPEQ